MLISNPFKTGLGEVCTSHYFCEDAAVSYGILFVPGEKSIK
jgi:hypothetical protein